MKSDPTNRSSSGRHDALDYQGPSPAKCTWLFPIMGILSLAIGFGNFALYYVWAYHWTFVTRQLAGHAYRAIFLDVFLACFIILPIISIVLGIIAVKGGFPKRRISTLILGELGIALSSLFLLFVLLLLWLLSGFPAQN